MNKSRAKRFEKDLVGKQVSGWSIQEYINHGKSAAVFKGQKAGQLCAIKLFDPEIIEKQAAEIQFQRIQRELSLVGKVHPNLVEILDGGYWTEQELYYVVMEYLPWKNLAEVLITVPVGSEREIISQVASAARFLEELGICHRDIKPENIGISPDFRRAKLLDLGVIRPHGSKSFSDGPHSKMFVGTLKYSPPEFLLREELDTPEGWRAITFYQLGGVLHDLIMRRSLFADFENPFARLVNAVQNEIPKIESKTVSPSLVELARYCLLKPAQTRLQLVSWELFEKEPLSIDTVSDLKSRIVRRTLAKRNEETASATKRHGAEQRLDEYVTDLQSMCRLECIENPTIFPPVEIRPLPKFAGGRRFAVQFDPSKTHGLSRFLRLEFAVRWVDADSDISEVIGAAFVAPRTFNRNQVCAEKVSMLYKGIYAPDTVRRSVITALYRALDHAQGFNAQEAESKGSKTTDFFHELNLEAESLEGKVS
jgi:eukaryotic-like serine/threonine-protein kinase